MLYQDLDLPTGSPYVILNMACTMDGKIITGEPDEHVMDLGSKTDHETMRTLHSKVDAVMIGAGTLRATKGIWYESRLLRFVVSRSLNLPWESKFFTENAYVVSPARPVQDAGWIPLTNWPEVLRRIHERGVRRLLVEGGGELNAALFQEDLIDEVFLTLTPKVKLGRATPTIAGGDPFPRDLVQDYELISCTPLEDEVFLRYRRKRIK